MEFKQKFKYPMYKPQWVQCAYYYDAAGNIIHKKASCDEPNGEAPSAPPIDQSFQIKVKDLLYDI